MLANLKESKVYNSSEKCIRFWLWFQISEKIKQVFFALLALLDQITASSGIISFNLLAINCEFKTPIGIKSRLKSEV